MLIICDHSIMPIHGTDCFELRIVMRTTLCHSLILCPHVLVQVVHGLVRPAVDRRVVAGAGILMFRLTHRRCTHRVLPARTAKLAFCSYSLAGTGSTDILCMYMYLYIWYNRFESSQSNVPSQDSMPTSSTIIVKYMCTCIVLTKLLHVHLWLNC